MWIKKQKQVSTQSMIEKLAANNLFNVNDLRIFSGYSKEESSLYQKKGSAHFCVLPRVLYLRISDLIYQFSLKSRSEYTGNGQYSSSVSVSRVSASSLAFAISLKMVLW